MNCIMLHGLGQTSATWNDTIKMFSDEPEVFCPNLSDWLSGRTPCYDTLYRALEQYCQPFQEPVHICGLSLDGVLAMQYAIEHPEKIKSLVLIGTRYAMPKHLLNIQTMLFRLMPRSFFEKIGFQKTDVIHLCNSMTELHFKEGLKTISCPTLILCGDKDKVNKTASLELHRQIKNAEFIVIEGAGHEVNVHNPTLLGQKLNTFFQQCD